MSIFTLLLVTLLPPPNHNRNPTTSNQRMRHAMGQLHRSQTSSTSRDSSSGIINNKNNSRGSPHRKTVPTVVIASLHHRVALVVDSTSINSASLPLSRPFTLQ